jgi:hypothetical protein
MKTEKYYVYYVLFNKHRIDQFKWLKDANNDIAEFDTKEAAWDAVKKSNITDEASFVTTTKEDIILLMGELQKELSLIHKFLKQEVSFSKDWRLKK